MMKLSRLFPLLALLPAANLCVEDTHKEVCIASSWPAQNTAIAMLGYGDNIVRTSIIAKRVSLFCQNLPRIEKAAAVSVSSGHEINPEQIIVLGVDMFFVPQSMVVPQQALLKQARMQVLASEANSLRALTQRMQQTITMPGPDAQQKALACRRYFGRNVALVTGCLKDLPAPWRVSLYHSMGSLLTTTGRPSLNRDWIDLAGGKNIAEDWPGEHQQNRSGEAALEKIVTANPVAIVMVSKRDANAILNSPQWAGVGAVIHHHVYVNPKGMSWWCRETSEEALQFLRSAKTLYPTRFADVDIRKETREFYWQFLGLTLSDAQISDALSPPR